MDRYPYHKYTILLGATRALAHIGIHFTHRVFGLSSVMMAGKMLRKSYPGYLAYAVEVRDDDMRLEDIPVVSESPDVFPDDLPGLPQTERLIFRSS